MNDACVKNNNRLSSMHEYEDMDTLKVLYYNEDRKLFEKSNYLSNVNISADQLGLSKNKSLAFLAAIIELANLDNFTTAKDKLDCLLSTVDLIYAELKLYIIKVYCISSESDFQIPVVEDYDASLILLYVVIMSKPLHLKSNIAFIENFITASPETKKSKTVFNKFKCILGNLSNLSSSSLRQKSKEVYKSLHFKKFMMLTKGASEHNSGNRQVLTPLEIQNQEVLARMLLAMNNKDC